MVSCREVPPGWPVTKVSSPSFAPAADQVKWFGVRAGLPPS